MLALAFAHLIAAATNGYGACTDVQAHVLTQAVFSPPDNVHPTNRHVKFLIDLGSDGRERRVAMIESSGDATFDAAALAAARAMTFAGPTQNCVSTSSVAPQTFDVPLISLATAPPSGSGALAEAPTTFHPAAICPAPFVQLTAMDLPEKREAAGTVAIDVGLSATAHVTSVHLAHSSGNAKTDDAATAAARSASYQFLTGAGCAPKPTIYRLELTYH